MTETIDKSFRETPDENNSIPFYFENLPQPSVLLDSETKIIYANREARKLLGVKNSNFGGKYVFDFLQGISADIVKEEIKKAGLENGKILRRSLLATKLDGTQFYIDFRLTLVSEGNIQYMLATFDDISEQRAEKKKLAVAETRAKKISQTESILDTISESFCIVDHSWIIRYWNQAAERATGKDRDKVLGKHMWEVFPQEEGSTLLTNCQKSMINRVPTSFEHFSGEGTYFYNAAYPNADGGITIYFKNISERKKRERERELLIQELTRNNSDLLQFSFITSHNLRAPLSNVLGLVHLMNTENMDEETASIVSMIESAAGKLSDTINDLSEMLLIKNRSGITTENISIGKVFARVNRSFLDAENHIDAQLTIDLKADQVAFNERYLESIFVNLISNAIKYRDPLRRLHIDLKSYSFKTSVVLEFTDNGLGIDMNRHGDRLFGMYQRFHQDAEGQGLGLFIIKSQIDALGGSIEVLSQVGKGTTFKISFPN